MDRPGLFDCKEAHPEPDTSQMIVSAIEEDLNDRKGMKWDGLDDDVRQEIRDAWADVIRRILAA